VQSALNDIAGLLIISRILTFFLNLVNEWLFNRKIKKETQEEFRDVFTYSNIKKTMVENQEIKSKNIELEKKVD
jgi:hypothetical protein